MATVNNEPSAKARAVLDIVEMIPSGAVMSYGDVAAVSGLRSPRYVGYVLSRYGDAVPWHRVVMSDGSFARHLAIAQAQLLRAERTPLSADGTRADMTRARLS
jgi:methylated-DNA-protein-cysteine methyltransferase-like protein